MNTWHFFFVLFLALNNQTCDAHVNEISLFFRFIPYIF
ncbi:MAG: hypothetical protein RJB31_1231 [Bacteroidota bacterium]|jgi:hypothetical protein